jgi:DNA mismatch endonuclease, patch repair protein
LIVAIVGGAFRFRILRHIVSLGMPLLCPSLSSLLKQCSHLSSPLSDQLPLTLNQHLPLQQPKPENSSLPMADIVSAEVRSRMMSGIRSKGTKPEILLRRGLHRRGFRYKLHEKNLPGKPDLVFPRYRAVLFANGCFWHGHDCHLFKPPSSRVEFWSDKIARNREMDARVTEQLRLLLWRTGIVWECALKGRSKLPYDNVISVCDDWLRSCVSRLEVRGV